MFKNLDDDTKKRLLITIGIICIILLIVYYIVSSRSVGYAKLKEDRSKNIVYTVSEKVDGSLFTKKIPYLNLNFDTAKEINKEVDEYISTLKDEEEATISYDYAISGQVLSYLIEMVDYSDESGPKPYFKSYNINLKTKKLVSDQELLSLFGYESSDVEKSISKGFNKYYDDLVKKEYYDEEECDYDCFLGYRGVEDYLDDVVFFVKEGKLYAVRPFNFYSIIGEEEYFKGKHFRFLVKKQES